MPPKSKKTPGKLDYVCKSYNKKSNKIIDGCTGFSNSEFKTCQVCSLIFCEYCGNNSDNHDCVKRGVLIGLYIKKRPLTESFPSKKRNKAEEPIIVISNSSKDEKQIGVSNSSKDEEQIVISKSSKDKEQIGVSNSPKTEEQIVVSISNSSKTEEQIVVSNSTKTFKPSVSDLQVLSLNSLRLEDFGKALEKQFKEETRLIQSLKIQQQLSRTTYSNLVLFILEEIHSKCKQDEQLDPKTFMISKEMKNFIRQMLLKVIYCKDSKRIEDSSYKEYEQPGYSFCNKKSKFIKDGINEVLGDIKFFERLFVENSDPTVRLNLFIENSKSYSSHFKPTNNEIQEEDEDEDDACNEIFESFEDFMDKEEIFADFLNMNEDELQKINEIQSTIQREYSTLFMQTGSSGEFGGVDGSYALISQRIVVSYLKQEMHGIGADFGSSNGTLDLFISASTNLHMIGYEVRK